MVSVFISLFLLGLAAVDPVGIAVMPVLLVQQRPLVRSLVFLLGSFVALMVMGVAFAQGLGGVILRQQVQYPWLMPAIEAVAGVVLLIIAGWLIIRLRAHALASKPSTLLLRHLQSGYWQLFGFGAIIVTLQSIVDVVFVIAMVRSGALHAGLLMTILTAATYAIAALLIQVGVVVAYSLTPQKLKRQILNRVQALIERYAHRSVIAISLALGFGLVANGILAVMQFPHL